MKEKIRIVKTENHCGCTHTHTHTYTLKQIRKMKLE